MARNVFISFRFKDGAKYKDKLANLFDEDYDTVDYSEDEDRSNMTEDTIKKYLYKKLKRSSVTIVLLTSMAVNHEKNLWGKYDDWMYDEIRYSLENRENNRTNGLVAVYTPEAENLLITLNSDGSRDINQVDNLFRKNMLNVKPAYKTCETDKYDRDWDSYCSLVSWEIFTSDVGKYIDIAAKKRDDSYKYNIVKRLD